MAPILYFIRGTPTVRAVMITAKALEVALDEREIDFRKGEHRSPQFLKLNPQHTVPTLDDDGNVICDSHAINAYLVGKYGKDDALYPKDLYKRALVDQRLHFDSSVLFPLLRTIDMAFAKGEIKAVPAKLLEEIKEAYEFLEIFLEHRQWIAGSTATIADFSVFTTVTCLDYHVKVDSDKFPNFSAWMKRVQTLPCLAADHEMFGCLVKFFEILKSKS